MEIVEPVLATPPPASLGLGTPPAGTPPAPVPPAVAPVADVAPVAPIAPVEAQEPTSALPVVLNEQQVTVNTYLNSAGITADHVEAEMDSMGKLSDMTIAIIRQKHGEHSDLIINQIENNHANYQAQQAQLETTAHNQVAEMMGVDAAQGGAEMTKIIGWAVQAVPDAQMQELANLVDAGGLQSQLALQELVKAYTEANGQGAQLVGGDVQTPTGGATMDRAEYNRQRFEIEKKFGYNSPQMVTLQNQRTAAINSGY